MSRKSTETKKAILDATLSILRESGADGITMRKVAALCGRSLNNVQYYYKNKSVLLLGLANYYIEACSSLFDSYAPSSDELSDKEKLKEAILFALRYASQLSDDYIVFRELWAISTRSQEIEEQLTGFYAHSFHKMCSLLGEYDKKQSEIATSILLPYLDGYSIQHKSLPVSIETLSATLTDVIYKLLIK